MNNEDRFGFLANVGRIARAGLKKVGGRQAKASEKFGLCVEDGEWVWYGI